MASPPPATPLQSAKAERKAIALEKELARLREQSQVPAADPELPACMQRSTVGSPVPKVPSLRHCQLAHSTDGLLSKWKLRLPPQAPAGARFLLRLPGLLRLALLAWLVYQSSEWRLVACVSHAVPFRFLQRACQAALPARLAAAQFLMLGAASDAQPHCSRPAAAVPVVAHLQPETVWPLGRWLSIGAGAWAASRLHRQA